MLGQVYSRRIDLYRKYPLVNKIENYIDHTNISLLELPEKSSKKALKYRDDEIPVYMEALHKLKANVHHKRPQSLYTQNPLRNTSSHAFSLIKGKFDFDNLPPEVDAAVPEDRKSRKREQIVNLMIFAIPFLYDNCVVCDFACGSGHQSIPLAYHFPNCKFVLVDIKQKSLEIAKERANRLRLRNVSFFHGKIEDYTLAFDVGLSLHACGVATDLSLRKCYQHDAVFISCPCCIGKVVKKGTKYRNNILTTKENTIKYPKSTIFQEILNQNEFNQLARAGDFGHNGVDITDIGVCRSDNEGKWPEKSNVFNSVDSSARRICKSMIELDRLLHAEEAGGYETWMFTLEPKSCTPKNDLLIGAKKPKDIARFKAFMSL